jgi:hypothetical protein
MRRRLLGRRAGAHVREPRRAARRGRGPGGRLSVWRSRTTRRSRRSSERHRAVRRHAPPTADPKLTGRSCTISPRAALRAGAWNELVIEVLPALRGRVAVDVRTSRLPAIERIPPRIAIETRGRARASVLAVLVYGDPPQARVDGGKLVHLRARCRCATSAPSTRGAAPRGRLGLAPALPRSFRGRCGRPRGEARPRGGRRAGRGARAFALAGRSGDRDRRRRWRRWTSLFATRRRAARLARLPTGCGSRGVPGGGVLVALRGGGYAPLPLDWLSRFGARIADLLARATSRDDRQGRCSRTSRAVRRLDEPPRRPCGLGALFSRVRGLASRASEDLAAELRPYQRHGVAWLQLPARRGLGRLLADDMGLGKDVQALCASGKDAVVAPTSVVHNWSDEIRAFARADRLRLPRRRSARSTRGRRHDHQLRAACGSTRSARARPWDTLVSTRRR